MDKIEVKTEVEKGEFKGHPTMTIWELDHQGNRLKYPVISFGKGKAHALIKHQADIQAFVEGN